MRFRVYTVDEVVRRSGRVPVGTPWVFLGKDVNRRVAVARALGEEARIHLNGRLHLIAERLRQPFLDFIAELGRLQSDQLGWWSSSCSWKDVERSDLFLLICYEHLACALLREFEGHDRGLIIVIEDPWLFRQLREVHGDSQKIRFHGTSWMWLDGLRALIMGIGARAVWSMRLFLSHLKQRWFWPRSKSESVLPCIALYSYPQERSLHGTDGWVDPYLGDLDKLLAKSGYSVLRFSPPEVGGFERALAQRAHYFAPLVLWMRPVSVIRSLFASWHPVWPHDPQVGGLPIRRLLVRDWRLDRWRSSYLLFHVFFDCVTRFLEARRIKAIIFPYENQPWEKMLVLASQSRRVPTIGYQHGGGLSRFLLCYFHGSREMEWAPLPDIVVASGSYSYELLANGGIPAQRLVMGGNLRHQYLWNARNCVPPPQAVGCVRILVALPVEPVLGQHLICALKRAFPDGGLHDGIEFAIRAHPMCPVTEKMLGWPATILAGTFEEALRVCSFVLYTGSTTGMEALAMGLKVLRYRSELLLNTDRAEFMKGDGVVDCGDSDLREKVLSILHDPSPTGRLVDDLLAKVFPLPDKEVWLRILELFCQESYEQRSNSTS